MLFLSFDEFTFEIPIRGIYAIKRIIYLSNNIAGIVFDKKS